MVVAGQQQHAAVSCRAGEVAVAEDVAGSVDAGTLAVPHGEHAIDGGTGAEADLLRAPDRGRREVLVDAGLEVDPVRVQVAAGGPKLLVEAAEGRAAITRDEPPCFEPGGGVALPLHDRQANQRLRAGQVNASAVKRVLVVEGYLRNGHGPPFRAEPSEQHRPAGPLQRPTDNRLALLT